MRPEEVAALDAIATTFAEPVTYTGAGLAGATVMAIRADTEADAFQGPGATLRQVSYEIQQSALPQRPGKGNVIADASGSWRVNEVTRRDDVAAWLLIVEQA